MNRSEFIPQIPYGTKDLLPLDAKRKRQMETALEALFSRWGYDEVVTPAFEYLDTFSLGAGNDILMNVFKFFDKNNRTLALRPDMTTPLARMAATRLRESQLPFRLSYLANVFRYEEAQAGRQCEFYQAGVELMGAPGPAADAEVVALAVESLLEAGLTNFQISLGQVNFVNGVMEESELTGEQRQAIKQRMVDRDLVGLDAVLAATDLSGQQQEAIRQIPLLHGKKDMLARAAQMMASSKSKDALDNLSAIYSLLQAYGVDRYVNFDLGIIRDFEYYTGMVFEGYTPGLGFPVCGGGRYDTMLASFGLDCPATGFSLGMERVLLALDRQGLSCQSQTPDSIYIGWGEGHLPEAIQRADELRQAGKLAELAVKPANRATAAQVGRERGRRNFEYFG